MIPRAIKQQIDDYIERGVPPGGFLNACLVNDLEEAVGRADDNNKHHIPDIVSYLLNYCPVLCWGGRLKVSEWLEDSRSKPDSLKAAIAWDAVRRSMYYERLGGDGVVT